MTTVEPMWIVGVDAGGSKTVAWLARSEPGCDDGWSLQLCGCGTSGPANPSSVGLDEAVYSIQQAIDAALESACQESYAAGNDMGRLSLLIPDRIAIGAAGTGRPEIATELRRMIAGRYPLAQVQVGSDVSLLRAAARSASDSRNLPDWIMRSVIVDGAPATSPDDESSRPRFVPGVTVTAKLNGCLPVIAIVAGTGSIVWADDGNGRSSRWGGLGPVVGDIGSGCWLGQQAIQAAQAALKQRGAATELLPMLLRHYQVLQADGQTSTELLNGRSPSDLALLAPLVIEASRRDVVAAGIVQRGLDGLAAMALEAAQWLVNSSTIVWSLGGGLLTENPYLTEKLLHKIHADSMVFSPSRSEQTCLIVYQPVWGAVLAAAGLVSTGRR